MKLDPDVTFDLLRGRERGRVLVGRDGLLLAGKAGRRADADPAVAFEWPAAPGARLADLVAEDEAAQLAAALQRAFAAPGRLTVALRRRGDHGRTVRYPLTLEGVSDGARVIAVLADLTVWGRPEEGAPARPDIVSRSGGAPVPAPAPQDRHRPGAARPGATEADILHLAMQAPVGLAALSMDSDGQLAIGSATEHFHALMAVDPPQPDRPERPAFAELTPADRARLARDLAASRVGATPLSSRFRLPGRAEPAQWRAITAGPPSSVDGHTLWVVALSDVSADVAREDSLRRAHLAAEKTRADHTRLALHDSLTGLANRRYFDEIFADRRAAAQAGGARDCTLVRLDLDRFRHVNDTLGHGAGDRVLTHVAETLRASVRGSDLPARSGSDQFTLLMAPGTSLTRAKAVVERIRHRLAAPFRHDGRPCRFGVSFGIATCDDICETGADLFLFADAALDRAKSAGGNRVEVFTPARQAALRQDRALAVELYDALEGRGLVPYFQPQIRAADGQLSGAEVLLRWEHPTRGTLAPDAFMPVAEHLRLVPDIDRIMMERAAEVLERWRDRGLRVPKLSFNVSAGRMQDPGLVAAAAPCQSTGTKVTFELLESILLEEANTTFHDRLSAARAAGIDIEVDDFGSGHASIIGLMATGPRALKIDKRLVFPVVEDAGARAVVGAIVEIARALGMGTVAEGVETAGHVALLAGLGVEVLQGYHFARPLSEAQFYEYAMALDRDHGANRGAEG